MKRALLLLLASWIWASAPALGENWDARLTNFEGTVTVVLPAGEEVPAERGMPLAEGDVVRTGPGARAEIALEADSLFELGPGSEFEVGSVDRTNSSFKLNFGRLLAKLRSMIDSGGRLQVRTPTAVASVRGTEFGVDASGEGTTVGVFDEGKVALVAPGSSEETALAPHQEAELRPGAAPRVGVLRHFDQPVFRQHMAQMRVRRAVLRKIWSSMGARQPLRQRLLQRRKPQQQEEQQKRPNWRDRVRRRFGRER